MTWHAPPEVLRSYALRPEALDEITASSVEGHLVACEGCRTVVGEAVDPAVLDASWSAIIDRIDQPQLALVERFLRRIGVGEANARLIGATRALQVTWLAATVASTCLIVLMAGQGEGEGVFLTLAPILPLALVALAFSAGSEPAGEVAAAAPLSGVGLVLRRAIAVLMVTMLSLGVGAALLPGVDAGDAGWVLPALALSVLALALSTWVRIEIAAGFLTVAWLLVVWVPLRVNDFREPVRDLAALGAPGQFASLALILVGLVVLTARRDSYALSGSVS
ncbi:MAG: hypothetical protein ABIP03_10850 [Aquihabitans sp.]